MNVYARAKSYIDKVPGAVSGDRGHDTTLTVACTCVRFGLSDDDSLSLLREYSARCSPPWSEKELAHKLKSARAKAASEAGTLGRNGYATNGHAPSPYRQESAPSTRPTIRDGGPTAPPHVTCPKAVAIDLPEPIENGAVELLRALYKPDDCVRIVQAYIDERDGREKPSGEGLTLPVRDWLQRADARGGRLASLWTSSSGAGVYVGMNPLKAGGTKDEDVTDYRFVLVEGDTISPEEQWAGITASAVPCAAVIFSGSKSVHAWVRVDAKDRREYDERAAFLRAYFPWFDKANINPARLSRLPDAKRKGRRQELLAINCGASSWLDWQAQLQRSTLGPARTFGDLLQLDPKADPNCVLGYREGKTLRYLCRGKSAWLLGPSGVGKSSLIAQFAVGWAIGHDVFGIGSGGRKLRSLIVQAENDDHDLAEMVQGVASAHGLTPEDERWPDVVANVLFRTETSSFGSQFCRRLREMIEADRPDVVWVDPLLSFAGIDVSKQDQVTPFLRAELQPVLEASGVVMFGVHHTGKPKTSRDTAGYSDIDWAYAGIGSSELVNWARAVMLLRPSEPRLFELKLAKRGSRAGAAHPDGSPAWSSVWIRQAIGRIHWEHVSPPEEPASDPEPGRRKSGNKTEDSKPMGRPSVIEEITSLTALSEFLASIPSEGESKNAIAKRLENWLATRSKDVSAKTCKRAVEALVAMAKVAKGEDALYRKGPNA